MGCPLRRPSGRKSAPTHGSPITRTALWVGLVVSAVGFSTLLAAPPVASAAPYQHVHGQHHHKRHHKHHHKHLVLPTTVAPATVPPTPTPSPAMAATDAFKACNAFYTFVNSGPTQPIAQVWAAFSTMYTDAFAATTASPAGIYTRLLTAIGTAQGMINAPSGLTQAKLTKALEQIRAACVSLTKTGKLGATSLTGSG